MLLGGFDPETLPRARADKVFDALAFAFDNAEVMEADLEREKRLRKGTAERPKGKNAKQMELPFEGGEEE